MADLAAQKREARRRRILENSENRLKKISGLYSNAGTPDPSNDVGDEISVTHEESSSLPSETSERLVVNEPEVNYHYEAQMDWREEPMESPSVQEHLTPHAPEDLFPSAPEVPTPPVSVKDASKRKRTSRESKNPLRAPESSTTSPGLPSVFLHLCGKTRLHIFILAVIVRIVLTLPCAVFFGESAIVPLCTVELAEWLNTKLRSTEAQDAPSGLLGIALMLSGIAPGKVTHMLGVLDIFNRITQDFFIYFFVFSMTHAFLELISEVF